MRINVRFVERPLYERSLNRQVQAIKCNSSNRELEISDEGIMLLTALVGKGMANSTRSVVSGTLFEIMNGELPKDTAKGNILTEIYGEMFGPLFTCLEYGGEWEMIRLIENVKGKCPDMLLLSKKDNFM